MTIATGLQLLLFGLVWGGLYALIASGLNVVFGVMKILNIAHGELLMLGAYITFWLFSLWNISPLVSVPVAAAAMCLLGVIMQKILVEPISARARTPEGFETATLIVFFGVLLIIQNVATLAWTADYRVVNYMTTPLTLGNVSVAENRLIVLAVALLLSTLMFVFLRFTLVGKAIRAVSQDRETAKLMGIDVKFMGLLGFGIGAAIAGAAGALASLIYVITPTVGLLFTIKAFTVMVVGGLGNQIGIFVAGLALGIMESFASYTIGAEFKDATGYVLLIGFIVWRSRTSAAFAGEGK
ncbi:MAG: branched-chain amino acid ABC transporter permease [Xanthobacteraceae bacterium]